MPRWHRFFALSRKEILDILRDRRTLFLAVIFPLVLYPLLIIGLVQAAYVESVKEKKERPLVAVSNGSAAPDLAAKIEADPGLRSTVFDGRPSDLRKKGAVAGIVIPKDFADRLSAGETAAVRLLYDSADPKSVDARRKLGDLVGAFAGSQLAMRLESRAIEMEFIQPVDLKEVDIATPRQRGVVQLGRILAFLLVVLCMMGALYPALDAVCGEKERGTLETLLSIPATRLEILGGKYVAVLGMSLASVVANFLSLSLTMLLVNVLIRTKAASGAVAPVDFSVPLSAFLLLVPALVPLAAFFSALSLGIAAFARSTREGQYYLAPLYAIVLPLTAAAVVPSMELTYVTAVVPVMSISLFLKDGLLGTLRPGPTILAISLQVVYAALSLKWAARVFSREEVLFASPAAETAVPPEAKGLARPSHALFVWAVTLILTVFLGGAIAQRLGPSSIAASLVVTAGFILAPALVFAALERLDVRRLFPVKRVTARGALSIFLFVAAAFGLSVAANALQHLVMGAPPGQPKPAVAPALLTLLFSYALIPAFCEEVFYRGFILQSLQARLSATWAVGLSAAVFALGHFNVLQFLPLFVLGVLLAVAMRRTGTLLVPIAVHFIYNAVSVTLASSGFNPTLPSWTMAALGAGGLAFAWGGFHLAGRDKSRDSRGR